MNSLPMYVEKIIPFNIHLISRLAFISHSIMPSGRFLHNVKWEILVYPDTTRKVKLTCEWLLEKDYDVEFLSKWADRKRD